MPITSTQFQFPGLQSVYHGKVRDVYYLDNEVVMVATDRISAFDVVLPRPIPFKGQVLNQVAAHFLNASRHLVPNWLKATPDPQVAIGHRCEPVAVEMVIRGYLAGHAWRQYAAGHRTLCGVPLPDGLRENDKLPEPIITPTTKASAGHDQDISREEILRQGLVSEAIYSQMEAYTRQLFQLGAEMAAERGLILVDTKYEFGMYDGEVMLMDEIHTPDSSRYFYRDGYAERQASGEEQKQLSKEFVRRWLIANGFQGLEGQSVPDMPDEFIHQISNRYIELYEQVTGQTFQPAGGNLSPAERIQSNLANYWAAN